MQSIEELNKVSAEASRVLLFARSDDQNVGSIGAALKESMERHKHHPAPRAWDFVALAVSVFAADQLVPRNNSSDGWTRDIELSVAVADPMFWNTQKETINAALRFLTTDRWSVTFAVAAERLEVPMKVILYPETSISLLSGGMDSLIGAVDLAAAKEKVLLVSQVAHGDRDKQRKFAEALGLTHLQLTHGAQLPGDNEQSTRSRSIIFIAYGVMAATLLESYEKDGAILRTPENGFMSINPPLTNARLGALSTRTTHPIFMALIQALLNAADLRVDIQNPYQFKTKGEMLKECSNREFIKKNAHKSTSCGRFVRTAYQHCGRCVPCLVRRSAFHHARIKDKTAYKYDDIGKDDSEHARFDDVRSAALAVATVKSEGLASWLGASLASTSIGDPEQYRETVGRGIKELGIFLKKVGV
ncbi:MAG: Qat anti-phage system QueC-like protein QatC [Pirellulales bacterium]|nr:Qat anti-phage system QueC-like protein QatC [Pirellulales bacterium]